MKNIELTENHKIKLLEMCKELFPEYYIIQLYDNKLTFIKAGKEEWLDKSFVIHWFEFCMIHLAEKILDNSYGDIETSELGYFGYGPDLNEDHPIDYLYKKFKKIKINV